MEIRRIMVIGAGFMGSGIAQVMAAAGYNVVMQDITDELVARGMGAIKKNLTGQSPRGSYRRRTRRRSQGESLRRRNWLRQKSAT